MIVSDQIRPAVLWRTSHVLIQKVSGFLISMVLARLVAPEEFGLIAMMLLFTGLASLFIDSGFSTALIQKQNHTYEDECTVFWFNILVGSIAAVCLILGAPSIARFYGQSILEPLIWIMAGNVWVSAWTGVHSALLSKKLNFQIPMKASLMSTICSGLVAIFLATRGWGVWALAIQTITSTIIGTALIWMLHDWRPSRTFSLDSLRSLYQFGGYIFLSSLLYIFTTQLHTLLVGKFYSASALGYFNRAASTKDLPQSVLSDIFSSIAFPIFSSYSHDKTKLRSGVRTALVAMMAINLPVMLGILVTADVLIPTLFGARWNASVPFLQVLCGVGALWPLQVANLNALMAQGHSKLFFNLELIKRALFITIVVFASQFSVIAIAWGMLIAGATSFFINSHFTRKYLGYGAWAQLSDISAYFVLSILMAIVVFLVGTKITEFSISIQLIVRVIIGSAFYLFASFVFKLEALKLAKNIISKKRLISEE